MTDHHRPIPPGYAETVYEAELVERHNQQHTNTVLELLKAHAAAELRGMTPGSMEWATFIVQQLPSRR